MISFRKNTEFTDFHSLEMYVDNSIAEANKQTSEYMLGALKDIIMSDVYDAYTPMNYDRTFQFVRAWSLRDKSGWVDDIQEIYFDTRKITTNQSKHQHTVNPKDSLPVIIETGNGYMYGDVQERPYWEHFQRYVKSMWTKIYKANFKRITGQDLVG